MEAKAYCSVLILHVVAFLHYTGYPVETTPLYQLGPVSGIKCIYSIHMHMFVIRNYMYSILILRLLYVLHYT